MRQTATILTASVLWLCSAAGATAPAQQADSVSKTAEAGAVIRAEGDRSGRIVVQLRGRNVADDWVVLVRQLQSEGYPLRYVNVRPPENGGLCQTYTTELRLPGCSEAVLDLARSLNPKIGDTLSADQVVRVPVLPLHASRWTILLDREVPEDRMKLEDLEVRWQKDIVRRQEIDTQVRLFLRAYNVYLPPRPVAAKSPAPVVAPSFDELSVPIQKRVIKVPKIRLEKQFSHSTLIEHYEACSAADIVHEPPGHYSSLLQDEPLPPCARECAGNCPQINLFDTKLFKHPGIKDAVQSGGEDGEARPASVKTACPPVKFNKAEHHATMLATIMVARDQGRSQFVGLAQKAKLSAWAEKDNQGRWAEQVEELALDVEDTPQVFVFASQFAYDEELLEGGSLKKAVMRLGFPDVVRSILDNNVIWITAAGHNDEGEGHELWPGRPESPMNLGDQSNIIVVTSCEVCRGKRARLWPNAHFGTPEHGLVNLAAPGGTKDAPIPGAANGYQYSKAWGTSQATAFVGGVAGAMLSCYPDRYKSNGRWLKTRLQVTSDPLPDSEDAAKVTGGIVNIKRALLDPQHHWLDRGSGWERLTEVRWCKGSLALEDVDSGTEVSDVPHRKVGSIVRVHESSSGKLQWQLTDADPKTARVRWSRPGAWPDNEPILAGKVGDGEAAVDVLVSGAEISAFIPSARFDQIGVAECPRPN